MNTHSVPIETPRLGLLCCHAQEYAASGDKEEVRRILRDLAVPFFHHEFVKQVSSGLWTGIAQQVEAHTAPAAHSSTS